MIVSVGWPLSRQLALSPEAILECAAHLLRTEDSVQIKQLGEISWEQRWAGKPEVPQLGQLSWTWGGFQRKQGAMRPRGSQHVLLLFLSKDACRESLPHEWGGRKRRRRHHLAWDRPVEQLRPQKPAQRLLLVTPVIWASRES